MKIKKDNNLKSAGSLDPNPRPIPEINFPIIGLGASAGGLEAFEQFFRLVPHEVGMAFVLVPHLDPGHASMLTEILQRITAMPVVEAKDQMAVAPNHVYVIPPNREMTIFHGAIQLSVPEAARGQRMPIDSFFRSLAEDQGEKAICAILSGTGTDGTLGLRAIHGAGGVSFVQEPAMAKYDGMPSSAVQSGLVIRRSTRRPTVLFLYSEKSWPVRERSNCTILPKAFPAAGAMGAGLILFWPVFTQETSSPGIFSTGKT